MSRRLRALLCCAGALVSCERGEGRRADADARTDALAHEALRDESRLVLERLCGQCHVREYPTALPGALAVFDLREPDWSARMSEARLRSAEWRLGEPLPPDGRPSDASPDERARFRRYVEAELARRERAGRPRGASSSR